jgi:aminoglycoside phosphotransferase (APT) family kinase protein
VTGVLRAHDALHQAGLHNAGRLIRVTSSVNEVWFVGPYVLYINPRPERHLLHQARVLEILPSDIPTPELVAHGGGPLGEWLIVTRIDGVELSRTWLELDEHARQSAITDVGHALRRLHQVNAAEAGLELPPFLREDTLDCPHQLPAGRLLDLLTEAAALPYVDRAVVRAAVDLVVDAADALDEDNSNLVHGDLHFENVLVNGGRLAAIIDFEWTRPGPPDLDLDVLLHSLADPALHVATDYPALPRRRDFDHVTLWLRQAYPELFAHPRLVERLTVYRIAYDTRALLQDPPDRPPERLSPHHPYQRLQRVVEGRSSLGWILAS